MQTRRALSSSAPFRFSVDRFGQELSGSLLPRETAIENVCRSRDRLFVEYRHAVRDWVASINNLGRMTHDPQLMEKIEDSRSRALTAKAAYLNHIAKHSCNAL
jgi:hypothetical protein